MREIKFRVWWVHPESDSMGFDYFKAGEPLEQSDPLQEYSQIEQFTGLRDKSGKEIYEGDIIVSPNIIAEGAVVSLYDYSWSIGACWPFADYASMYGDLDFEVIGHIHL